MSLVLRMAHGSLLFFGFFLLLQFLLDCFFFLKKKDFPLIHIIPILFWLFMTRLTTKLIRKAKGVSRLLPPLLRANRDINRAQLELRWIKNELPKEEWIMAINRRARLVPLQYILKSQPFGGLSIACREGVLVPRWETEEWCTRLAELLEKNNTRTLKIVDACTGTGCIPLLLNHQIKYFADKFEVIGFDVSIEALELAKENLKTYISNHDMSSTQTKISFQSANVFDPNLCKNFSEIGDIDIVTANPPYIPTEDYLKSTQRNGVERSVRLYEPRLALVGDVEFYTHLINNVVLPLSAKGFVFELGYVHQACAVRQALDSNLWGVGTTNDSATKLRCVVGWRKGESLTFLESLCDTIL